MRDKQCRHLRLVHADADPIAGNARLRHFEQRIADPVMIADAHFGIRQSLDCKILSELAIGKVVSTELVLPITIRFDLVDKDGPMFAAMTRQISLAVSIDVEPPHHPPALDRCLPDGGVDGFPLPFDVAWQADIYRKQAGHCGFSRSSVEAILSHSSVMQRGLGSSPDGCLFVDPKRALSLESRSSPHGGTAVILRSRSCVRAA